MTTKNFKDKEFGCKHCGQFIPNSELQCVLELTRLKFGGKPVIILSGTRCEIHNKNIGGAKASKHMLGEAADFYIVGVSPREIYDFLVETFQNNYGIGCYDKQNFVHVDVSARIWRQESEQ